MEGKFGENDTVYQEINTLIQKDLEVYEKITLRTTGQ